MINPTVPKNGEAKYVSELIQLKNLLNSSLDVICSFDAEGKFIYASPASKKVWGYEPEELIGQRYIDMVIEEDRPKTNAAAAAIISGIDVTNFENRYRRKDGSLMPIVWSATWNAEEQVMYGVARDASEKRAIEKELLQSKHLFQTFMDHSPLPIWITEENCLVRYMNAKFLKTYGFSADDVGKTIYELFPQQTAVDFQMNNLRVTKEGKAIETVEKTLLDNGREQISKVFQFPIVIDGVRMVAGWLVDITDQTELQQELAKSVERYHYVNEATSDAIYDWDVTTNVIYRGSGFETLFGFKEKETTLLYRISRIHPDDVQHYKNTVYSALQDINNNSWKMEYRMKDANGSYRNVIDKAYIINSEGKAIRVIGAIQDITEHKALHQQLIEQEQKAKREVVRSIIETQEKERRRLSVDLHDNVNQMLASCKLMLEFAKDSQENAQMLAAKSYESLQEVINEIRRISHDLNPSVIEDIGLIDAIEQMAGKINMTEKIKIVFQHATNRTTTLREEDKISAYRIIQEQLCNVLKHSQAKQVIIQLQIEEEEIRLLIEDDGKGFDPSKTKKGLGLKNIQNRVEYYQGHIQLTSAAGKGCKMKVRLRITGN